MKKRSIKARVTGWYVFFLVLMFCLIFASLLYTSNQLIQQNIRGDLAAVVNDSLRDISIKNRQLEIDDDMISYRDGVSVLVYQENNFIITGTLPEGINQDIPFVPDKVRKISDSGKNFYVFDYLIRNKEFSDVWVRGITSAELKESDPALGFMMKLFFIFLPLLILFAALGGYYITKKAFLPVAQITQTARRISTGNDLSQRIQLPSAKASKDEIYHLASTFDTMLTRLERSFEAEKQFSMMLLTS